jgi:hypothetical protein
MKRATPRQQAAQHLVEAIEGLLPGFNYAEPNGARAERLRNSISGLLNGHAVTGPELNALTRLIDDMARFLRQPQSAS